MTVEFISKEVARLVSAYKETDPFKLCRDLSIEVLFSPMGERKNSCKGFFLESKRNLIITINSVLPDVIQRIILAHELGHGVLHRKATELHAFHEFSLFDETSKMEYEANLFAAELLLDDSAVLDTLNRDISFFGAAAELCVPAELLDFKFRVMKRKGYMLVDPPMMSSSDFLKKLEVPHENTADFN